MTESEYSSIALTDAEVTRRALQVIGQHLGDLPLGQARRILRQAELMMDATTFINCDADEFRRACEGFQSAGVLVP
ncbi:hypothetical protein [Serratia liquefaciens]|uniref:hypothetical protein n=1 Tax=Serratia liquefaciens TaxID=614 RepID=UPI0039060FC8